MSLSKKRASITQDCVACGNCIKSCPMGAITVNNGIYAIIDQSKCVGCGKCAEVCPAGVIKVVEKGAEPA